MGEFDHKQALPPGFELKAYRLVDVLGVGGFGVTYLAEHATLGHKVAIKEYLPNEFAVREGATVYPKSEADREDFEWGLTRFLDEAKTLARFEHRNLVQVRDYFEANSTAYIVMEYEEGESLDALLEQHGRLSEAQLRRVLLPIIEGLREVHGAGYLHRDIKPSNIYVRRSDESPVLLDFGAARQALGRKSKSLTAVASAGYSPPEQYESEGNQGPWTDIYALSVLCYRAITGHLPMEAPRRMNRLAQRKSDPLPKLVEFAPEGFSESFLEAVDQGLQVIIADRPRTLDEWVAQIAGVATRKRSPAPAVAEGSAKGRAEPVRGRGGVWLIGASVMVVIAAAVVVWLDPLSWTLPESGETPPLPEERRSDSPSVIGGGAILVVETEPSGAEVLIGGELLGQTPLERGDIRAGVHSVTLRHPHYQLARLEEQALADGRVLRIQEILERGVGSVTIRTEPREAWIERDGERLAQGTPVTLDRLPAGPLELTIGTAEHRSIRVRVEVPKDGVGRLERTLERIPYGTLTLELVPSDAAVTLPDVAPAYRPGVRLPEGDHRVVVSRAGYRELTRTVTVAGDTRVSLELVPKQPFTVTTSPANARVRLLDVAEGYRDGVPLVPGEYRIEVSASEYETHEETVRHGTQPTRHAVTLTRRPQPFTIIVTPAAARVRFVGSSQTYLAGMRLAPGSYRVQVSASGYEPRDVTVRHGAEPTQRGVALEWIAQSFSDDLRRGKAPEMVVIPAGSFRMGCMSGRDCYDHEKPVHTVTIRQSFAMSKYEVTFSDWDACVSAGGCNRYRPDDRDRGRGNRPVINVSWRDARLYASWLSRETGESYRLPSEAEWEYAARAGSTTRYSWGNDIGRNRANCDGCGSAWDDSKTAPVGSFAANAFGLHDMHGNVSEWVEDCWNDSYAGAPSDGSAWLSGECGSRGLRGGSWLSNPRSLRSVDRRWFTTGFRSYVIGFRVARTLTP